MPLKANIFTDGDFAYNESYIAKYQTIRIDLTEAKTKLINAMEDCFLEGPELDAVNQSIAELLKVSQTFHDTFKKRLEPYLLYYLEEYCNNDIQYSLFGFELRDDGISVYTGQKSFEYGYTIYDDGHKVTYDPYVHISWNRLSLLIKEVNLTQKLENKSGNFTHPYQMNNLSRWMQDKVGRGRYDDY